MFLPYGVMNLFFMFEWDWVTGLPFIFFYTWALLSTILLPMLIFLQGMVLLKGWIGERVVPLKDVMLFVISIGLFGFGTRSYWMNLFSS